jgi:hypothetical protein
MAWVVFIGLLVIMLCCLISLAYERMPDRIRKVQIIVLIWCVVSSVWLWQQPVWS